MSRFWRFLPVTLWLFQPGLNNKISNPNIKYYSLPFDIPIDLRDILDNEIVENVIRNNNAVIKEKISRDVAEINICFNYGAYKASVVMCGSVLEAVLLDWLWGL